MAKSFGSLKLGSTGSKFSTTATALGGLIFLGAYAIESIGFTEVYITIDRTRNESTPKKLENAWSEIDYMKTKYSTTY